MTRIVTLGEVMLRLKAPGHERFLQSPRFEATFGGAEANVAVSLANFGMEAAVITAVPGNEIGKACIAELRRFGVDTSLIIMSGDRLGIYYLEAGANQRPSTVIYDRSHSAMADIDEDLLDWDQIFTDVDCFHISGITPAISQKAADLSFASVKAAKARGITVCCDFSFRNKLWKYGESPETIMGELIKHVDIIIANREDCEKALGITVELEQDTDNTEWHKILSEHVMSLYPNLKMMASTLRESSSADNNSWAACLRCCQDSDDRGNSNFYVSRRYAITDIIDRVGSGDTFAAGLIYGYFTWEEQQKMLEFATAASCLKHSIDGDFNRLNVTEVEQLLAGDASGRVQR